MKYEEMEYVLTNTNFINWLIKKLKEHYYIDEHDNNLKENDIFFVKKIKYLYDLVDEYARHNNIEPTKFMQYNLFYVNYLDNIFFVYERNNSYGCFNNTLSKKEIPYCINLDDVRKSKIFEIASSENSLFVNLKNEINRLNKKGISKDFIYQIIKEILFQDDKEKGYTFKKEIRI